MTEQQTAISARGVVKNFGALTAVDQLNLDIPRQQIYGFLGPNGSGKSTTIRVLLGLLSSSAGQIEVLGYQIPQDAETVRRQIGYMTQSFSLYQDLTIRENLDFVGHIHGISRKQRKQRITTLLDRYALKEFTGRRASQISGGQKQRLALACAVFHRPKLLVLDEPTSAVDPQNRRDFWDRLFDLLEHGTTILVSTHYMDEAERCHQLAILKKGRLAAQGKPPEMMVALNGRVLLIEGTTLSAIRQSLVSRPGITSVSQLGARLRVLLSHSNAPEIAQMQSWISAVDNTAKVRTTDPSLEDVFVSATQTQPQHSVPP